MERDKPKFAIPYAAGESLTTDVRVERFADGGVTVTIPRARVRLSDTLVIFGVVLTALAWIVLRSADFSAISLASELRNFPQFWLPLVFVVVAAAVFVWPRASGRLRPHVIGISHSTVYLDVSGPLQPRRLEVSRETLLGIELVFPRRSLSTRPVALLLHLEGHPPVRVGDECSSTQVSAIFAELKPAILRTSCAPHLPKSGNPG